MKYLIIIAIIIGIINGLPINKGDDNEVLLSTNLKTLKHKTRVKAGNIDLVKKLVREDLDQWETKKDANGDANTILHTLRTAYGAVGTGGNIENWLVKLRAFFAAGNNKANVIAKFGATTQLEVFGEGPSGGSAIVLFGQAGVLSNNMHWFIARKQFLRGYAVDLNVQGQCGAISYTKKTPWSIYNELTHAEVVDIFPHVVKGGAPSVTNPRQVMIRDYELLMYLVAKIALPDVTIMFGKKGFVGSQSKKALVKGWYEKNTTPKKNVIAIDARGSIDLLMTQIKKADKTPIIVHQSALIMNSNKCHGYKAAFSTAQANHNQASYKGPGGTFSWGSVGAEFDTIQQSLLPGNPFSKPDGAYDISPSVNTQQQFGLVSDKYCTLEIKGNGLGAIAGGLPANFQYSKFKGIVWDDTNKGYLYKLFGAIPHADFPSNDHYKNVLEFKKWENKFLVGLNGAYGECGTAQSKTISDFWVGDRLTSVYNQLGFGVTHGVGDVVHLIDALDDVTAYNCATYLGKYKDEAKDLENAIAEQSIQAIQGLGALTFDRSTQVAS